MNLDLLFPVGSKTVAVNVAATSTSRWNKRILPEELIYVQYALENK